MFRHFSRYFCTNEMSVCKREIWGWTPYQANKQLKLHIILVAKWVLSWLKVHKTIDSNEFNCSLLVWLFDNPIICKVFRNNPSWSISTTVQILNERMNERVLPHCMLNPCIWGASCSQVASMLIMGLNPIWRSNLILMSIHQLLG